MVTSLTVGFGARIASGFAGSSWDWGQSGIVPPIVPPPLLHWGSDLHHSLKLYQANLAPSPFSFPQALALTKSLHAESCLAICFSEDPDWHAFPRSFLKWPTYSCLVRSAQFVQLFARAISSEQPWGSHSWETGINRGHRCTGWCKQRWAT